MTTIQCEGSIKECPGCGKWVISHSTKCLCGFEFRESGNVKSMQQLYNQLQTTNNEGKKNEIIRNFPIPNNKEDLLEFISVSASNSLPYLNLFSSKSTIRLILLCFSIILLAAIYILGIKLNARPEDMLLGICLFWGPLLTFGYIKFSKKLCEDFVEDKMSKAWNDKFHTAYNKLTIIDNNDKRLFLQSSVPIKRYFQKKILKRTFYVTILVLIFMSVGYASFLAISTSEGSYYNKVDELISTGKYDECEDVIRKYKQRYSPWGTDELYYHYMEESIKNLCEEGLADEAYNFLNKKINFFKDKSEYNEYNEAKVYDRLIDIIHEY